MTRICESSSDCVSYYEINIGLIVGCMPILPLYLKHSQNFKKVLSYIRSYGTRNKISNRSNLSPRKMESRPSGDDGNHGLKKVCSHALSRQYRHLEENEKQIEPE